MIVGPVNLTFNQVNKKYTADKTSMDLMKKAASGSSHFEGILPHL